MTLFVDYRERDTTILEILYQRNLPVEIVNLAVGDYVFGTTIIERKEIKDFLASMINNHMESQLEDIIFNLSKDFNRAFLVLHGEINDINWKYVGNITMPVFFSMIGKIISNYPTVGFVWLNDEISFSNFLSGIYFQSFNEKTEILSLKKRDKRLDVNTLCSTDAFSPKTAKEALKKHSLQEIFNMDTKELIKIDGYGKQRANKFVTMREK